MDYKQNPAPVGSTPETLVELCAALREEVESLHFALSDLENELAPVSEPEVCGKGAEGPILSLPPLLDQVRDSADGVSSARARVRSMQSRLRLGYSETKAQQCAMERAAEDAFVRSRR